jgi:hypothetical protein
VAAREHSGQHVRDDLAVTDDDFFDFSAQSFERADECLNPGILIHRALLSRSMQPFYREPSSGSADALRRAHVCLILLDATASWLPIAAAIYA